MILGSPDSPDLLLTPVVNPKEVSEPQKIPYTCKTKVLIKDNFLSEFKTKSEKDKVLQNLGIYELAGGKWGTIIGNIEDQRDLMQYLSKIKSSADSIEYTNISNPNITNVKEALDQLLYEPLVITMSITPQLCDINQTTDVYLSWKYNKAITTQNLANATLSPSARTYTFKNVNKSTTYTLYAKDEKQVYSTSASIDFVPPIYYGDSVDIPDFSHCAKKLSKTRQCSLSGTSTRYIYIFIPESFGEPRFFVGGFEGGFQKLQSINYKGIIYNTYRSDNSNLGQITVDIK